MFLGRFYVEKRTAALVGVLLAVVLVGAALLLPGLLGGSGGSTAAGPADPAAPTAPGASASTPPLLPSASATPSTPSPGAPSAPTSPGASTTPNPSTTPAPNPSVSASPGYSVAPGPSLTASGGVPLPDQLMVIVVPQEGTALKAAEQTAAIVWGQAVRLGTAEGTELAEVTDELIEQAAVRLRDKVATWDPVRNLVVITRGGEVGQWYVCPVTGPQASACETSP